MEERNMEYLHRKDTRNHYTKQGHIELLHRTETHEKTAWDRDIWN
jgi:hypothetical protein